MQKIKCNVCGNGLNENFKFYMSCGSEINNSANERKINATIKIAIIILLALGIFYTLLDIFDIS